MRKKTRQRLKLCLLISTISFFLAFVLALYSIDYTKQQFAENIFDTPYARMLYKSSNPSIKDLPYYGDIEADMTFVAFTDVNSDASRHFAEEIYPALKKDYLDSGTIKFYHKPYITIQDI